MTHNLIVPFKIHREKKSFGVTLARAHGVSYRSFKILTVQLAYSGNVTADDAGLLKSTMEMVLPQATMRRTEFLMYLMGHLLSERETKCS